MFDDILEDHVLNRTMDLGLDLATWGEVALVVAARQKNPKWKEAESFTHWAEFEPQQKPKYSILPHQTTGKLSEDFEIINTPWKTQASSLYSLDLTTLTYHKQREVNYLMIEEFEGDMYAHFFQGFTLILPASIVRINKLWWNNEAIMVVCQQNKIAYILPWHSLDHRHNWGFENAFDLETHEIHCHGKDSPMILRENNYFSVLDMDRRYFLDIHIALCSIDTVLTVYDGLFWGYFAESSCIIPFYVDYDEFGMVDMHFRTDRAVYVDSNLGWKANERFLYRDIQDTNTIAEIVDLGTGTTTLVVKDENTNEQSKSSYFVGLSEGKLKAWSYFDKELCQYDKALKEKDKRGMRQEEYDVSAVVLQDE